MANNKRVDALLVGQALEPYNWKVFRQYDPDIISGIAVHNLSAGQQNRIDLLCTQLCLFFLFFFPFHHHSSPSSDARCSIVSIG
jgi:hypothetical protein